MVSHSPSSVEPEFSLKLTTIDVPSNGTSIDFSADEETCAALARRFGILELSDLRGTAKVRPFRKHGLTLECRYRATVVQACVVTLEPVVQYVDDNFIRRWLPEHMIEPETSVDAREVLIEAEGDDVPDPMEGNTIDIGEAIAEALALTIDPYPRKPGVAYSVSTEVPDGATEERPNPFAVLEKLKKND